MRFAVLLIAATAFAVNDAAPEQCSLVTPNPNKQAFLDRVDKPLNGHLYSAELNGTTYKLSWCVSQGTQPKAAVVKVLNKTELVIGRYDETDVIAVGGWNIVTFAGGELIDSTGLCNATRWKALILMECHTETTEKFTVVDPLNAGCFAVFHLITTAVCPPTPSPTPNPTPLPPLDHTSRWTVFFMLLLTAGVCYLVIGMAYRRFVLGAKGLEQIPNYDFWRDPCSYTRDYCNRRDMRNNEPWSNSSNMNDNVDEPLLHP